MKLVKNNFRKVFWQEIDHQAGDFLYEINSSRVGSP